MTDLMRCINCGSPTSKNKAVKKEGKYYCCSGCAEAGKKRKVHLCYCQIPKEKLKKIARLRFVQEIPTEKLMEQMKTQKEKEYLAAIALLDVKAEDLPKTVTVDEPFLLQHLLDCRGHIKEMLAGEGIPITEH